MRDRAWAVAGPALAASLLLPWFYGTDDGDPLTTAGWDTEPGFTVGVIACACGITIGGILKRPLIAMLSTAAAIALTVWMLPRGDLYSGYDPGPGAFVALAVGAVALVASARRRFRR
jgi:hypothetical protein